MGFFEDALTKTKEALDIAYKKTEEVVNTEKQKFDISSIKSKREKDYAALGKLYYNTVKDNTDEGLSDDIKQLISSISEKTAEIDRLNREVQNAKNKRICPVCNANIDINSVYCSVCGAKLTVDSQE